MQTLLERSTNVITLREGKNFLRILAQAVAVADPKIWTLVASGDFETYLDRFMTSGKMKKSKADALLEDAFKKMIEGQFSAIDSGVHILQQGFGTVKKDVYNVHLQGDLMITYQRDDASKTVRLFYLGNHSNHPMFKM